MLGLRRMHKPLARAPIDANSLEGQRLGGAAKGTKSRHGEDQSPWGVRQASRIFSASGRLTKYSRSLLTLRPALKSAHGLTARNLRRTAARRNCFAIVHRLYRTGYGQAAPRQHVPTIVPPIRTLRLRPHCQDRNLRGRRERHREPRRKSFAVGCHDQRPSRHAVGVLCLRPRRAGGVGAEIGPA